MMDLLSIDVVRSNGAITVVLSGEIDFASSAILANALLEAVESANEVIVDVGLVTYLDSTAIRALVAAHDEATARGRVVTIKRPSSQLRRVLEVSGVLALLTSGRDT
jgi:anti-sigma B factor antagonist